MLVTCKNTANSYGIVARIFHWGLALFLIGMLGVGLYMVRLDPTPDKFALYGWHKSIGVTLLLLALLRLGWRYLNVRPGALATHKKWEKRLAAAMHGFLYVAMIGMPLSGWLMSSAANFPVSVFGWFTLPDLIAPNKTLVDPLKSVHESLGYGLIAAIGLHIAGALKHHFIDKDATLRRMLRDQAETETKSGSGAGHGAGTAAILLAGALAFALAATLATAAPAMAAGKNSGGGSPSTSSPSTEQNGTPVPLRWHIVPEQSKISFEATQMGAAFKGQVNAFDGEIFLDPARPQTGYARITARTASIDTHSADRDAYIHQKAWLDSESFPESVFETTSIRKDAGATEQTGGRSDESDKRGENSDTGARNTPYNAPYNALYIAEGTLTLKQTALPVTFPFRLEIDGDTARAQGQMTINRLDFNIGEGQWRDTGTVKNPVRIHVTLTARRG